LRQASNRQEGWNLRINKNILQETEAFVNSELKLIGSPLRLKVVYRDGYVEIDIYISETGEMIDTLITALTKKEAYNILYSVSRFSYISRFQKQFSK